MNVGQWGMKILIADDEPLARELIRELLTREDGISDVHEAETGNEAVATAVATLPDILFLDVQMPGMNGFEVLSALDKKKLEKRPAVIFVTAYDEYAVKAFEYHAQDYLLKPFDRKRFAGAFRRAKDKLLSDGGDQREIRELLEKMTISGKYLEWVTIRKDERIILLKVEEIHWVEARGNYVYLKTVEGGHMLRATINSIEAKLDPDTFVRVNRSTIVNLHYIKELQVWRPGEYRVVMRGGKSFAFTRGYREHMEAFLKNKTI